jgi:hypothetical protein
MWLNVGTAVALLIGLALIGMGLRGRRTGTIITRTGKRLHGDEARSYSLFVIALGAIVAAICAAYLVSVALGYS